MALTDFLKDIADAIRYAEKSSGEINAQQFAQRIRALSGGQPTPTIDVEISYSFDNEISGNASGIITLIALNGNGAGNYDIMWGNADGIMSNYSAINSELLPLTETESVAYSHLIGVNAIPKYATKILAVKDGEIKASYDIPNNKLWASGNYGEHLYSVELLSDVHYQYESGSEDWQRAFTFGRDRENVSAICIVGDLTDYGTTNSLNDWKSARDSLRGATSVYSCNGNHEVYNTSCVMVENPNGIRQYLDSDTTEDGLPYFYKIINNDVYAFVACFDNGQTANNQNTMFTDAQLTWLENLLETYRNQRVFLFQHIFPYQTTQVKVDYFANANNVYPLNLWQKSGSSMADRVKFLELMEHYKNVIWFSGHSHLKWHLQEENHSNNYYRYNGGARFIHLPSLTVPRDIVDSAITEYLYADSEGALLDVYPNCVIIRGRNFIEDKYLGIASYLIDTTPIQIEPKPIEVVTLSSITATKEKTEYNVGDVFQYSDINVVAYYSNGTQKNVSAECSIDTSNVNMSVANTFSVPISYTEDGITKTTSVSITVVAVAPPTPTINPTIIIDVTMDGSIANKSGYSTPNTLTVNDEKGTKKVGSSSTREYVTFDGTSIIGKALYYRIVGDAVGLDYANKVGFVIAKYSSASASGTFAKPDYSHTSTEWEKLINEDGTNYVLETSAKWLNVFGRSSSSSTANFPHYINARIQVGYVD